MNAIPEPRKPKCLRHHVHLASCEDCQAEMHEQRRREREADTRRLQWAADSGWWRR